MARMRCSFCGKHEDQVRHLVAGPEGVAICNECVDLCVEVQGVGLEFDGDLLLTGIGELTTNDRFVPGLLGTIEDAAVAVRGGLVRWAGPQLALPDKYRALPTLACGGRAVVPGFVDAHTHALFGGEQGDRFATRDRYEDPTRFSTDGNAAAVASTRATSDARLAEEVSDRLVRMLSHGTTTVEVKSGYGGDVPGEHRLLDLAHRLDGELAIDIVSTLLLDPARAPSEADFIAWATEELMAVCGPQASYADLVADQMSPTAVDILLDSASRHGMAARMHVGRMLAPDRLAAAFRHDAVTADHLDHLTQADMGRLADSTTVAVFLPVGSGSGHRPPARQAWEAGVTVAIATDCNPVDSYVESMQLVIAQAVSELGLQVEQAIWSATRGGALAVEEAEKGWIGRGTFADLVVLDAPSATHLAYRPGINLAWRVIKDGAVVSAR